MTKARKPPLGLIPRFVRDQDRLNEIWVAIQSYVGDEREVPIEWVEEYNEIIKRNDKTD